MAAITNLSGDLANATNWLTADAASVTLARQTHAEFLAENPGAIIPAGHQNALGILRIAIGGTGGPYRVRGRNLPATPAFSALRNIIPRAYMPPAQRGRWATMLTGNSTQWFFSADAYSTLTNYYTMSANFRPSTASIRMHPGTYANTAVPASWGGGAGLQRTLSGLQAVAGAPGSGNLTWMELDIRGDAAASPSDPLLLYLFDVVEIVEAKPTLYFRWDDGTDGHLAVADHMLNGTTYAGGSLASPLPSTFHIIDGRLDTSGYLTTANLTAMAGYGATLALHGEGGTWSESSSASITAEIEDLRAVFDSAGFPASWGKVIAYPGNDDYRDTTDGALISALVRSLGVAFNTGSAFFGYGFAMDAMGDPLQTAALVTLGQSSASAVGTSTDAETLMAHMAASGLSMTLMGHAVVVSAPGSIDITQTQFDSIMGAFATEIALGVSSRIRVADIIADAEAAGILSAPTEDVLIRPNIRSGLRALIRSAGA